MDGHVFLLGGGGMAGKYFQQKNESYSMSENIFIKESVFNCFGCFTIKFVAIDLLIAECEWKLISVEETIRREGEMNVPEFILFG